MITNGEVTDFAEPEFAAFQRGCGTVFFIYFAVCFHCVELITE
jgi:hypothetical protein